MTDKDEYDEDGRNLSSASRQFEKWIREGAADRNRWLNVTAEDLARVHGIENRDAMRNLLSDLSRLPEFHPSILTVEPGNVEVQSGLTPWKEARTKLRELARVLADADGLLWAVVEDPVPREAILQVDTKGQVGDMIASVRDLRDLIELSAKIEGTGGNRPKPDWHARAAELCRKFWTDHKSEKPTPYFNKESQTGSSPGEPANEFSKWFCDVMHSVAKVTVSECQTALRKKSPREISKY